MLTYNGYEIKKGQVEIKSNVNNIDLMPHDWIIIIDGKEYIFYNKKTNSKEYDSNRIYDIINNPINGIINLNYVYIESFDIKLCNQKLIKLDINSLANYFEVDAQFEATRSYWNEANFMNVRFNKNIIFDGASFINFGFFYSSVFYGLTSFQGCNFYNIAYFKNSKFYNKTFFAEVSFKRYANFENAEFNKEVHFEFSDFYSRIYFCKSEFKEIASFEFCVFNSDPNFVRRRYEGQPCIFFSMDKNKNTKFDVLNYIKIEDYDSFKLSEVVDFTACKFYKGIDFCNVRFGVNVDLTGATMHALNLFNACIEKSLNLEFNSITRKAIYTFSNIESKRGFLELSKQFNLLKQNYNYMGLYEYEDIAYVEFKRCERNLLKNKLISGLQWFFFDLTGEYGTNWKRMLAFMIGTILVFGILYNFSMYGFSFDFSYDGMENAWLGILISIKAYFTVSLFEQGMDTNGSIFTELLSSVEILVGVFITTYFTVCFARKVIR